MSVLPLTGEAAISALSKNAEVANLLDAAVKTTGGRETLETVTEEIASGMAGVWIANGSLIVSNIMKYPSGDKWMNIRIGTGEMAPLQAMMTAIEDYARERGCVGVQGQTRKGWAKIGKPIGYEMTHVFLEKAFNDGK